MTARQLGPADEPQSCGAIVAVHYGNYRMQEVWVRSGANIGNWYCLGGEFSRGPKIWDDNRSAMDKMIAPPGTAPQRPEGTIPQHPHWEDILARGPVTLLVPGADAAYRSGWRAGRQDMWQRLEDAVYDEPAAPR